MPNSLKKTNLKKWWGGGQIKAYSRKRDLVARIKKNHEKTTFNWGGQNDLSLQWKFEIKKRVD